MSNYKEIDKLYPQNISKALKQILLSHDSTANLTFQEAIENLKSEDFIRIHQGLISIRKQISNYDNQEENFQDQQIELLITIIQQIFQAQMVERLQFEALWILLQILNATNFQLQLLIKKVSFQSLTQIYNKDSNGLFHVQIIKIFGLLSKIDNTIVSQIYQFCKIEQKLDKIILLEDSVDYLSALNIFCKLMPQLYKNLALNFIKDKFNIIKNPESKACKIAIKIINKIMKIPNQEIDEQLLYAWDEIIIIWVDDKLNTLESTLVQLIEKFIKKPQFPKEKIEKQTFLDRLLQNLGQQSTFILQDSLRIYKYLIKQFSLCITNKKFYKQLINICRDYSNPTILNLILKIVINILKTETQTDEYIFYLKKFNIISLLPEYLDEILMIIQKLNPSSQLSGFFKEKQKNEHKFINCILKIVLIILNQKKLLDKFKMEIGQFERLFTQRFFIQLEKIDDLKIQKTLQLIIYHLENNKSFEMYETINKKIKIN
ncbi:unnamed protein product [Paramecium sonneborni]|uniref:Uncharacterized protein n=1 Tax=Paramecium sonneborni TaxID=65129 RepID=A0A8S1JXF7_9CILI|nr:unnamed protein product [Paramecium sonneborni]